MAPRVLLISLDKAPFFDEMYQGLLAALRENSEMLEATSAAIATDFLALPTKIDAVLVTDPGLVHDAKFINVASKAVAYAREGGTLIFCGHCSSFGEFPKFETFFERTLCLPWRFGSYTSNTFRNNGRCATDRLRKQTLVPKSFQMKALHLQGVPLEAQVYITPGVSPLKSTESPIVFAKYGLGHVGWIGDVNSEVASTDIVVAMCNLPR